MTWTVIAVLIIIGFLFLLLEVLVLPGTNIAGIIGFILIGIGVWQAYEVYGGTAGTLTLSGTVVLSVVFLYFALKSKTWKKASLKSKIGSRVNVIDREKIKVGDTGRTISRLNPMGKALVNGDYFEVRTTGDYLEPNEVIMVIKIDGNKITVEQKNTKNGI